MKESEKRNIQIVRGICIIAVVFLHCMPGGEGLIYLRPLVNFGVGTFLFLSGMLSDASKWHPARRLLHVICPYVIWSFVYTLQTAMTAETGFQGFDNEFASTLGYNLMTGKAAGTLYFIFVYCQFTILIPVIDKLARSRLRYLGFLIAPVEIILMRMIPLVKGTEFSQNMKIAMSVSCLAWFTYFYLGYLMGNNLIKVKMPNVALFVLIVLAMALQIPEGRWYFDLGFANAGTQLKLTAIASGALICVAAYRFIKSYKGKFFRLLKVIGDCSFGIYFAHIFFMRLLKHLGYIPDPLEFPLDAVALVVISLAFTWAGSKLTGKVGRYLGF